MSSNDDLYDVIVIGSGIGGLATASLLAQLENKRVLILERHFKIGGFTHTFTRKGKYEWDVGLHYVGQLGTREPTRAVFDFVTGGKVDWKTMPEVYDRFVYPGLTFDARTGSKNLQADLIAQFPHEKPALEQYFRDLRKAGRWMGRYGITQLMPGALRPVVRLARKFGSKLALMTTGEYMERHFTDERLKGVLVSQWGLYGLPPNVSAFGGHATVVSHYFTGGYYPVGGSGIIAKSIVPIVESRGGKALVNHSVDEIIVDKGKAVGVRVTHKKGREFVKKTFYADVVISNAGALTTYTRMMPEGLALPFDEAIRSFPDGTANVTLYLGLKDDPSKLGFRGENYWVYAGYDHDALYAQRNDLAKGRVGAAYLSFPSMKNPEARGHTAEIIAFMDAQPFVAWEKEPWRRRGEDYEQLKERISNALVAFLEKHFPGFQDLIDYRELSTPITTENFTNHRNGNIYGLPMVP
ncbi:MAG: NAD(P)/FAD-dependent oxidoreductase, partial [Bacteroidetes bacterium]|nr:NAD(P)/FAD-dependent oxidoreductase [Bacteroidota bacterium]